MSHTDIILTALDYGIVIAFIVLITTVGLYFSKRAGRSTGDFFLGGRSLPWYLAGTSMVATTFAADTPLAVTELIRQGGIAGNWLWWNMLAGGMLTTFFFARYWRRANILTDVELVQIRYSGKEARFLRGFKAIYMGVLLNAVIIAWVNLALMTLLQVFWGLSLNQALGCAFIGMLIVYIYSGFSGLLGVVYTDFLQFITAMTGSIILAIVVLNTNEIGGIDGLKAQLPEGALSFFPSFETDSSISSAGMFSLGLGSFLALIALPWWNSWYPGAEPGGGGYVAQRMMSAKDEKNAVYANLFFQIAHYCIRPWPWVLVGLSAIILYPQLDAAEAKMGYVLAMKDYLPAGFKGLLLAAFLAAYMSTTASQLNWGSSYLINDFYRPFVRPNATEKQLVRASRIAVFIMILVAIAVTSQIQSIAAVWNFLIQAGAGLGLVLILRWYWWRVNAWSEIAATLTPLIGYGLVKFVFARYLDPSWAAPIIENPKGFIFTLGFTAAVWLLVTYKTRPTDHETLQNFYNRVQPAGNWKPYVNGQVCANKTMWSLVVSWLSGIVMAYSILFASGSLIFKNWVDAGVYTAVFIVATGVLRHFTNRAGIFK